MTVESAKTKAVYTGNGAARVFPVPFEYSKTDDIHLLFTGTDQSETDITSNYRVNVNESGDTSVTYPVTGQPIPAGTKLTVYRGTPRTQIVDLIYGGSFDPNVLENDGFDRAVMMVQELQEEVDRAVKVSIADENLPKTAEELYAEVNKIADRAEDAVGRAEDAAERAEDAADRAAMEDLKNLSIAVDDAPYGHMASGSYNADTGMLTLRVPQGKQGEKGEQGNSGVIVEMNGIYAFEIQGDDLVILYDDGSAPPAMHIDDNGDLIWEVQ